MIDIESFLQKYLEPDEKFILACSTGPDSMYLLHQILKTPFKKNMVVAYFNHKLRPEADEEEVFIETLAKKEGFIVEIGEADIKKIQSLSPSKSTEQVAREKRYAFFEALLHIHRAKYVLTAHHLDDKIETFFFNLVRGTKLTGLINMTESSGNILRPLLSLQKNEIIQYLDENDLAYTIDNSNSDTDITRNKLRRDILPQFESINSNYKSNLQNIFSYFSELKDYLDREVQDFLGQETSFLLSQFFEQSLFLQKEIIRYLYFISNGNSTIGLSEANISEILKFMNDKGNFTKKDIHTLHLRKKNGRIFF